MTGRLAKPLSWIVAATLVVLLTRSIAYAIAPSSAARLLEHRAGGPALPVLTLVALALGGSLAVAVCWLAAFGVRERALLERRTLAGSAPRFRPARTLVSAIALAVITSLAGGLFEVVIVFGGVIEHFGAADHAPETQFRGQIRDPFGVFTAGFSEAVIEMRDADTDVKLVIGLELRDGEQQSRGISSARNRHDDRLVRHWQPKPAPLRQ